MGRYNMLVIPAVTDAIRRMRQDVSDEFGVHVSPNDLNHTDHATEDETESLVTSEEARHKQ